MAGTDIAQTYRYKPREVMAIQWTGTNLNKVRQFMDGLEEVEKLGGLTRVSQISVDTIQVELAHGYHDNVTKGGWIIKTEGPNGDEIWAHVREEIFRMTFETKPTD